MTQVRGLHNILIVLVTRTVHLLPDGLRGALDSWAYRAARERALQRQRRWRPKT